VLVLSAIFHASGLAMVIRRGPERIAEANGGAAAARGAAVPLAQQLGRAVLRGVVLGKGAGEPIAGAWVILEGFGAKQSIYAAFYSVPMTPSATTDREGRFEILGIDPGSYTLTVMRNGYARQVYGQRAEGGPAPPLELSGGESRELAVRLTPAGSVSGAVRDASGLPVSGTEVRLLRRRYSSTGNRSLSTAFSTRTDDRGEYRFYWITPGRYDVQAAGEESFIGRTFRSIEYYDQAVRSRSNEVRTGYGETYYPGVREIERSVAIQVLPRSELRSIDITITPERGRDNALDPVRPRLRVRVLDPSGQPASGTAAVFLNSGWAFGEAFEGTFVTVLWPGTFWIGFAAEAPSGDRSGPDSAVPTAFAKVIASESDIDLTLTLHAPPVVEGRVLVDGELPASATLEEVSIRVEPAGGAPPVDLGLGIFSSTTTAGVDGAFTLNGIPGHEIRVTAPVLPPGFYLKEARLDGAGILGSPAYFSNRSRLDLVISSRGGRIEGLVTDDRSIPMANVPVVLVPDLRRDRTELFKSVDTDSAGRFSIAGVPPGDYRLFAWEALEPYSWLDPEILAPFESSGAPVNVLESSTQTVQLEVIPESSRR
jgi:hypothetical protein